MFNKVQFITSQNLTFIRQVLHGAIMSYMEAAALALGKKADSYPTEKGKAACVQRYALCWFKGNIRSHGFSRKSSHHTTLGTGYQ
jgi:hypothetical protein